MIFCLEAMAFLRGGSPRDTLSALDSPPGTWPLSLSAGLAAIPGPTAAFIVERTFPGIKVEHRCQFMGLRAIQNGVLAACRETGFGLQIHPCDSSSPLLADELCEWAQRSRLAGMVLTAPMSERADLVAAVKRMLGQ